MSKTYEILELKKEDMTSLESYIKEYYQQILKRLREMEADLISRKKRDYHFNVAFVDLYSIFVLYILLIMSVSKSKNLERKLDNFAKEAKNELNNVCGSSLWESLGFVFFDQLENSEKIAKANFYYGQLQIINEIKFSI